MLADLDSEFTAVGDLTIEGNNVKFGVSEFDRVSCCYRGGV